MATKEASVLNVVRDVTETAGASIKLAVDLDMSQVMRMETHFVIMRVIR